MGISFLGPDFNASEAAQYMPEENSIRVPLSQIKHISTETTETIVNERKQNGPFKSLNDLIDRVRIEPSMLHALIRCGAGDCWGLSRPALLWQSENILSAISNRGSSQTSKSQMTLFDIEEQDTTELSPPVSTKDYSLQRKLEIEMEMLGFTVSAHPLDAFNRNIKWSRYIPIAGLSDYFEKTVVVCGVQIETRLTKTIKNETMQFISIADKTGIVETVLFPAVYQKYRNIPAKMGLWNSLELLSLSRTRTDLF